MGSKKKQPTVIVHAARKPTADEKRRDAAHQEGKRLWAKAERMERSGVTGGLELTLTKAAALEAMREANGR